MNEDFDAACLREKPTRLGWLLGVASAMLAASAVPWLRFKVFDLLLHPASFAVATILIVAGLGRLLELPRLIVVTAALFFANFAFCSMLEPDGAKFVVKVGSSIATLLAAAVAVRNESDYRLAVTALVVAAAIIGIR